MQAYKLDVDKQVTVFAISDGKMVIRNKNFHTARAEIETH